MPDPVTPKLNPSSLEQDRPKNHFQGEWMRCKGCGQAEKSSKKRHSRWTFIEFDHISFYICPTCFQQGKHKAILNDLLKES